MSDEARAGAGPGQPVFDDTAIDAQTLDDATKTTPEVDRGAFNPRGRLATMGHAAKAGLLVGACFVGFMVYAMASNSAKKPTTSDDSSFALDDTAAEKSARQAAAVMVQPQKPLTDPAIQQVGTDPFGNPILANSGQDLSRGTAVPPPAQYGNQPQYAEQRASQEANRAYERAERERQARAQAVAREQARQDAMRRAPVMAVGQSSAQGGGANGPFGNLQVGGDGQANARAPGGSGANNPLQQRLSGIDIPQVKASRVGNRNFMVLAGAQFPCVLQTAMDSTQPGLTSCVIPHDVWSANGQVIVMEKGTKVLGEYQGGFSTGENRIFVLWNRAITPAGVSVSLGSPAADQLGRAGMGGQVDTFFWQRFGGALLLSIVGDASSAVSDRVSGVNQSVQAPNSAAGVAAQDSQRIRPRLRAPQGKEMTIMVARDVDFSSVYSLRLRR